MDSILQQLQKQLTAYEAEVTTAKQEEKACADRKKQKELTAKVVLLERDESGRVAFCKEGLKEKGSDKWIASLRELVRAAEIQLHDWKEAESSTADRAEKKDLASKIKKAEKDAKYVIAVQVLREVDVVAAVLADKEKAMKKMGTRTTDGPAAVKTVEAGGAKVLVGKKEEAKPKVSAEEWQAEALVKVEQLLKSKDAEPSGKRFADALAKAKELGEEAKMHDAEGFVKLAGLFPKIRAQIATKTPGGSMALLQGFSYLSVETTAHNGVFISLLLQASGNGGPTGAAAVECGKKVIELAQPEGFAVVKRLLPAVKQGMDEKKWKGKVAALELLPSCLHAMKHTPTLLSHALPGLLSKLHEAAMEVRSEVRDAATTVLKVIGSMVENPEVRQHGSSLVHALADPTNQKLTHEALEGLGNQTFMSYMDAASLGLLMPIVVRGLRERDQKSRKWSAQIFGSTVTLAKDVEYIRPYLADLLPLLQATVVDPSPEVKREAAKAYGKLEQGLPDLSRTDLQPWLFKTLRSTDGGDRSGASLALAEVFLQMDRKRLNPFIPEIHRHLLSDVPHVRAGFLELMDTMPQSLKMDFVPFLPRLFLPTLRGVKGGDEGDQDIGMVAAKSIVDRFADVCPEMLLPAFLECYGADHPSIRTPEKMSQPDTLGGLQQLVGELAMDEENEAAYHRRKAVVDLFSIFCERILEHKKYGQTLLTTEIATKGAREMILAMVALLRLDPDAQVKRVSGSIWKQCGGAPRLLKELQPALSLLLRNCSHESRVSGLKLAALRLRVDLAANKELEFDIAASYPNGDPAQMTCAWAPARASGTHAAVWLTQGLNKPGTPMVGACSPTLGRQSSPLLLPAASPNGDGLAKLDDDSSSSSSSEEEEEEAGATMSPNTKAKKHHHAAPTGPIVTPDEAIRGALCAFFAADGAGGVSEEELDYVTEVALSVWEEFAHVHHSIHHAGHETSRARAGFGATLEKSMKVCAGGFASVVRAGSSVEDFGKSLSVAIVGQLGHEEEGAAGVDPNAGKVLLAVENMMLMYGGGHLLLKDTKLELKAGCSYGVVGHNGCGKTTLMKELASHRIAGMPADLRVGHVDDSNLSAMNKLDLTAVQFVERSMPADGDCDVAAVLNNVNVPTSMHQTPVSELSGGWRMRLVLAVAIMRQADIVLMDEPTNHLDAESVTWLGDYLLALKNCSIMVISHDAKFLNHVCSHIIAYRNRTLHYSSGNFDAFKEMHGISGDDVDKLLSGNLNLDVEGDEEEGAVPLSAEAQAAAQVQAQQVVAAMQAAATASQKLSLPNPGRPDGIKTATKTALELKGVAYEFPGTGKEPIFTGISAKLNLSSRVAICGRNGCGKSVLMALVAGELMPTEGEVWRHHNLRLTYIAQTHMAMLGKFYNCSPFTYISQRFKSGFDDELQRRFTDFDEAEAEKVEKLAKIHGKYGKMVQEVLGRVKAGSEICYEIKWQDLDDAKQNTVEPISKLKKMGLERWCMAADERIAAKASGLQDRPLSRREVAQHLEGFGIDEEMCFNRHIGSFSAGQKTKMALGAAFWTKPHIVVLDEPNNYLDVDTVEALAKALRNFRGGVVLISPTADFIEKVCNERWVVSDGKLSLETIDHGEEEE